MTSFYIRHVFLAITCVSVLAFGNTCVSTARGQDPTYQTDCGNDGDDDNDDNCRTGCENEDENTDSDPDVESDDDADDCNETGANPINPYRANVHRTVTDLEVFGPAGFGFTREANSRNPNRGGFSDPYWELGYRVTWQHNWNYEMRNEGTVSGNNAYILLRYPDGNEYDFVPLSYPVMVGAQLVPSAWNGDRLYVTALSSAGAISGCTLLTSTGQELDFRRSTAPAFQLTQKRDGRGNSWTCTYSATNSTGRLIRLTNNFGRWIQIDRETGSDGVLRIKQISTNDGRVVAYNYSGWASSGKFVLASVDYLGGEHANYTYVTSDPSNSTARPLLSSAVDPAYALGKPGAQIKYDYNYDAVYSGSFGSLVLGTLLGERNAVTDQSIISLPRGSGTYPRIVEGDGTTEITRKYTSGRLTTKQDCPSDQIMRTE